jgi:hypothetical protein
MSLMLMFGRLVVKMTLRFCARDFPESSRMPPSANEGLADQWQARGRRRRERMREV